MREVRKGRKMREVSLLVQFAYLHTMRAYQNRLFRRKVIEYTIINQLRAKLKTQL